MMEVSQQRNREPQHEIQQPTKKKHKTEKDKKNKRKRSQLINIAIPNATVYVMSGAMFQSKMLHCVPPASKRLQSRDTARLSLTFRCTTTDRFEQDDSGEDCSDVTLVTLQHGDGWAIQLATPTEARAAAGSALFSDHEFLANVMQPDITKMYGKVFTNNGRRVATYAAADVGLATYRYGGKHVTLLDIATQPVLQQLMIELSGMLECKFDWVHCVYYPIGDTALGWHADDESAISAGTPIAGCVFYDTADASYAGRRVQFKPK
jgi:hypothetical protein